MKSVKGKATAAGTKARTAGQAQRGRVAGAKLTQVERTALSDQRMLDAAVRLIYEKGTHNTTLKDVGELAGYSRGLASSRFGSKDSLFFELLKRFNQRWKKESETAVGLRMGLDAFVHANKGLIAFFESESKFIRVMYMVSYEMVGSSELMRQQLSDQHEAYRHGVARWINEAVAAGDVKITIPAERLALQYAAGVFGILFQWLVHPEAVDIGEALGDLRETILAAMRP